jgi:hypothetical protein
VLTDEDNAAGRALYRSAGGAETAAGVMVTFDLTTGPASRTSRTSSPAD